MQGKSAAKVERSHPAEGVRETIRGIKVSLNQESVGCPRCISPGVIGSCQLGSLYSLHFDIFNTLDEEK
ncbi:hypothetical protein OUZ56_021934 [Daphnia magna]|uniref:Uncharacterized protein n=1 Tax=Daphnia magna TaxID=35525 RepID=A0ABR0AV33_9CRUS|nr:hypothetical protein OUZ56_021934 [Daphnia magna]